MHNVLREGLDKFVTVYLDDVLIFSRSPQEHLKHFRWVFHKLGSNHLHAKFSKCNFAMSSFEYLGHVITPNGIQVDPNKMNAIAQLATPICKKELQSFLGMCNYYAKFVHKYAHIAAPLYQLLHKDCTWTWEVEQ